MNEWCCVREKQTKQSIRPNHHKPTGDPMKDAATSSTNVNMDGGIKRTLLIGDSIIKHINEKGLLNTKVKCIPGAKINDISKSIMEAGPENFEAIVIHGGTNDCSLDDAHLQQATANFTSLIKEVKTKAPHTKLVISTVCPRADNEVFQHRVDQLNFHLKEVASTDETKCAIADNDLSFKLSNNKCEMSTLNRSKLHLSNHGTKRLLNNINEIHEIVNFKPANKQGKNELHSRFRSQPKKASRCNHLFLMPFTKTTQLLNVCNTLLADL
ncbi:uncharacterized protein LOC117100157 [Anneissia japonica]|uniref:uncharacterized protein LOC117100157 n=1 Tax=Anneissia japonica TaxID=1529436 RepID=UPI001425A807|nr:uncharacterized protein LOC117100157 [Anneissia japonica]